MVEVKEGVCVVKGFKACCPFLFFQKNPNRSQSFFPSHGSLFFSTPPQLQPLSPFASVSASPHHHNTEQLARRRQRRSSPTGDTSLSSFFSNAHEIGEISGAPPSLTAPL